MAQSVKASALRFLKIRPRSIEELRGKLAGKGFSEDEITATVDYLTDIKLLDDRSFTRSWIAYRLARPFGFRRIILELKEKGVPQDIIDEAIAEIKPQVSEADTIAEMAARRYERLRGEPQQKKKRVLDYLARRGFELDAIYKAIKKL